MNPVAGHPEYQREQLLRTISTLEAQRSVLGDSAVDLALGPVRTRLAEFDESGARPDPSDQRSEHKVVTVVFVDVSGFAEISEQLDSEKVRDLVNGLFERLVPVVERYGGVIDKFMGDEIMALFGAPRATEHHADHALRACLDMFDELSAFNVECDQALGLHVGVNSGFVVAGGIGSSRRQDYSVMGDAVNIAARLEDASKAGEILVGPASYRATASSFEFEALPPIPLKGKGQPLPVYRLLSARPRRERTSDGFTLAFEGRHKELNTLIDAVQSGAPALTIIGQPGLGKSRLLRELRRKLGSRWRWLEVAAMTHRSSATYGVLHDLFDEIIGAPPGADADKVAMALADHLSIHLSQTAEEHGPYLRRFRDLPPIEGDDRVLSGVTPDVIRQRLHRAIAALVATTAIGTRTVICIEDLHWADASSIELLADIVAKDLLPGVALVVTSRTDASRVAPWLDAVRRSGEERAIELDPLNADAVGAVLDGTLVTPNPQSWLRSALLERSEGNPFYLVSFLRSLVDDGSAILEDGRICLQREPAELRLPASLHAVVAERIDRLDTGAKAVLRQASIIGRRFRTGALDRLAVASGAAAPTAVLGTLLERQLIEPAGPDHLQFVHAVVQDVVYQGMLTRERRRLHLTLASLLADEPNADDAVIAWHLEQAGNEQEASRRYEEAAQRAQTVHANQDALAHVEKALRLTSASDHTRRVVLGERGADLVYLIGRFEEAADRFACLAEQSSGIDAARLCRKRAHTLALRQQYDQADAQLAIARARLAGLEPDDRADSWWREHFAVEGESLSVLYFQGRTEEMRTVAANLAPALEQRGTREERGVYHRSLALLELRSARMTATPETVHLAELSALELADGAGGTFARFGHAFMLLWSGDRAGAERKLLEVLEEAGRVGNAEVHLLALTYLAITARFRHDVESARAFAIAGLAAARLSGARLYEGVASANLAWVAWRQGEVRDRVREQLAEARDLLSVMPGYPFLWITDFVEVAIAATDGDLEQVSRLSSILANPPQQRLPDDVLGSLERAAATPTIEAVADLLSAAERAGYL